MDRLGALRTFVAVAQHQSFAEAARALHISPTAASRAVSELEAGLATLLLRRTTRSVTLTPEGAAYLERCRVALDELDDAERTLRGDNAEPRGALRISAPDLFGRLHVLPIATRLMGHHPDLKVELVLTQRLVKLVEDGIDIAVRIADLSDSALHAVRIADVHRVLVASPTYLALRGMPDSAAALHDHRLIMYDNFAPNGEWRFGAAGKPAIRIDPCITTNSAEAAIDAAVLGGGITRALCYQVAAHVRADRLRYVLADLTPPSVPVNLVFQAKRSRAPNVRAFIDSARAHFGEDILDCAAHSQDEKTKHKSRKLAHAK